jgi:hypothetical protein
MISALEDSATEYAKAYNLHPRNPDAVKGLNRTADEMLRLSADDPELRRQVADGLIARTEYFKKYQPVVDATR